MSRKDYVMKDLAGNWFNAKYPPDYKRNGGKYHGYRNSVEETLLYDFAVLGYDLKFSLGGKEYYFLSEPDYVAQCDENFEHEVKRFSDGNAVLEQFQIDGKPLISQIAKIEYAEPC